MPMKYVPPLNDVEIVTLQQMHAHHPSRRARMRAHSLLLSHQHYTIPQIARMYQSRPAAALRLDCPLADVGTCGTL